MVDAHSTSMSYRETIYSRMTILQAERFWPYVQICGHGDDCALCCWEWQRWLDKDNYGKFSLGSLDNGVMTVRTHRLLYLLTYGDIPPGLSVLHTCDNPLCLNPAHLWLGTSAENNHDRARKGRNATGDRNGARLYPERLARGDANASRLYPDRYPRGENHPQHRLTETQVREIRAFYGSMSQNALARRYGVTARTISLIIAGITWKHLA